MQVACDSLTWINGVTYTSSNNSATDTLQSVTGCDSVITLNLTINTTTFGVDTVWACDTFTWINGITYSTSNTTAVDTIVNALGCDSIVALYLTVTHVDSIVVRTGDSLTALQNGATYQWYNCNTGQPLNGETFQTYEPVMSGSYSVEVTLNGCTKMSICEQVNICNINANYSYTDLGSGAISFSNNSVGNITQYDWSFGDGIADSSSTVSHTYVANGNYVVVLAAQDSTVQGVCIDYYYDTISINSVANSVACQAGFSIYFDSTASSMNVVNSSTGSNLTYSWDFGDGNTSTAQFPSHTYASNGPFNLCLTVNDGNGCTDTFCDSVSSNGVVFRSGFTINVISTDPTGIHQVRLVQGKVKVFPNPISVQFWVEVIDWNSPKLAYTILDINGKIIRTKMVNNPTSEVVTFDVKDLSKGVYFIRVGDENQISTTKIIIQ
jgi:PKD repeat protein